MKFFTAKTSLHSQEDSTDLVDENFSIHLQ